MEQEKGRWEERGSKERKRGLGKGGGVRGVKKN